MRGCWTDQIGESEKRECMRQGRWGCTNEGRAKNKIERERERERDMKAEKHDESTA